jgi:transposase
MNIQLNLVLTDITGVSGLAMLRAIIAGECDPHPLAQFRQPGCKHSEAWQWDHPLQAPRTL